MRQTLAILLSLAVPVLAAAEAAAVFEAAPAWPAELVERIKPGPTGETLRRLTVEERVGEPRKDELVRAPLFLHADEPNDPTRWALYAGDDVEHRHPLPFQLDDIRRDTTGGVTRCHLYFAASLEPWQRKSFVLVRAGAAATPPPVSPEQSADGRVTLVGDDLSVSFNTTGPRAGAIAAMRVHHRDIELPDGWLGPALTLVRQSADCAVLRRSEVSYADPASFEVREIRHGAGPLFSKFSVRIAPPGLPDEAEFTYLVPRQGSVIILTERLAPAGPPQAEVVGAENHRLLAGRLRLGGDTSVTQVPAGLRRTTRATSGHFLDALVDPAARLAILAIPAVQTGGGQIRRPSGDQTEFGGAPAFRRNTDGHSGTLRAFWGELRLQFSDTTDAEALWHFARRNFQPLVAIVDEPDLGVADCRAAMPAIAERFMEIKYWGRQWQQDAAILLLHREAEKAAALIARRPGAAETDPAYHLPGWAKATPPQPRNPRDQGRLDPYHLAYGSSLLPLLHLRAPNDRQAPAARAIGLASRRINGRVNEAGWPYIDCFATAFNMQIGPLGLALFGGTAGRDRELAAWARDALRAPGVTAIYGHGQRPYPGESRRPEPSDFLYECICDFHLRSLELATGEDLALHPAALRRYLDCVDVTADLQHRDVAAGNAKSWHRANFFRGQAHDHRWEQWSAAPLLGLFAHAGDKGEIGSTEAAYWLDEQGRRSQPWAELMWFAQTDLLLETRANWKSLRRAPPLPADVRIERARSGTRVEWRPVPGAVSYRIHRAERDGGPWIWLNSPHRAQPPAPLPGTGFTDTAPSGHDYRVTAVDADGRESNWEPGEPAR